ncbi:hypothetical protein [Simplicispira piscis]|jgi:hypothetical protein
MKEVNKEHLQLAAVIASGLIQTNHQNTKPGTSAIAQALLQSYEAIQEAVQKIEQGQVAK